MGDLNQTLGKLKEDIKNGNIDFGEVFEESNKTFEEIEKDMNDFLEDAEEALDDIKKELDDLNDGASDEEGSSYDDDEDDDDDDDEDDEEIPKELQDMIDRYLEPIQEYIDELTNSDSKKELGDALDGASTEPHKGL